jgi:amidase
VTPDEYLTYDAIALAELVRTKKASPRELLATAIATLDRVNPKVNAVIHRLDEAAKAQTETCSGTFGGVPFLVKDLDGRLANAPWNGGSRALAGHVMREDSELFARYRKLGLVFLGKTNTPELGLLAVTEPELHGPTRNPWNLDHTPGGSSGGSAAAVAAGIVPVAHGGDGGGSIRIPASACGLFGLKPSRGRMPLGPHTGEGWHGLVVPHVLSRTVRDSAAFLDATHGPDVGAPYVAPPPRGSFLAAATPNAGEKAPRLRLGFTAKSILGERTHEDCRTALDSAMRLCKELGHEPVEVNLPIDKDAVRVAYLTIVGAGAAFAVEEAAKLAKREVRHQDYEAPTWFLAQVGRAFSALHLERARSTMFDVQRKIGGLFESIDALATPTLAYPPAKVGELALKPAERVALGALRAMPAKPLLELALFELAKNALERTPNTMLFNMTGQPAMSVPLHVGEGGLPIGVQFVGKMGHEEALLALAAELEGARPWAARRPSL